MNWKPEADDLTLRRRLADLGGPEAVEKHHSQRRLTVRERIAGLRDAGSFQEVGKLTGKGTYAGGKLVKVVPAPYVMGLCRIDGRLVAVAGARTSSCAAARAGEATGARAASAASSRTSRTNTASRS